jgi:quercetin dioxygenase-like cupin family protein
MNRPPSPRTAFTGPTHIPFETTIRRMWGDKDSGKVPDWVYISGEKIHQLIFKIAPGEAFRHSENYRTYFAADVVYSVLNGALVLMNPETGEARRAEAGDAVFFRRDTWHHGFNDSTDMLEVLEFLAPPPAQGTTSAYAHDKLPPEPIRYGQDRWLGTWPMLRTEASRESMIHVLRDNDALLRVEGLEERVPVLILVSTEYLTVGKMRLLPGRESTVHVHGGDEGLYVREGQLLVRLPESDALGWSELKPGDGFYVPQGVPHQYSNLSNEPVVLIFGVAPNYLP